MAFVRGALGQPPHLAPMRYVLPATVLLLVLGCTGAPEHDPGLQLGYELLETYPREEVGFTQGLELTPQGTLLHSVGRYGQSQLRVTGVDGTQLTSKDLPADHFAEGVTVGPDQVVYQLTWREGVVHRWSLPDLTHQGTAALPTDGWGACYDEGREVLWVSDGSATLAGYSLPDLSEVRARAVVTLGGAPVEDLNELECVQGSVWANVWHDNRLLKINPGTGDVTAVVDLTDLVNDTEDAVGERVLNGIAHDPTDGTWLVTGKDWSVIYRLDLGT